MRSSASVNGASGKLSFWTRVCCFSLLAASPLVIAATTITYTYDEHGRLETSTIDTGTVGKSVSYIHDKVGNPDGITSAVFDTGVPSTPATLNATVVSYNRVDLSWSASTDTGNSGLAGYRIYRNGPQIATTSATTYSDTSVQGSTTYTYTIRAYDNAQNLSEPSPAASVQTPANPSTNCAFAALNAEGSDEFTVYAFLQRTAPCGQPVTVTVTVQHISGTGSYGLGPLSGGPTINPSDQSKSQAIWPYYGSVLPGSPLRLKLTWTISSGSGVIFPAESYVTFYNSDCYC